MAERITVARAAELLGTSALTVRYGMECGTLPIGSVIKISDRRTIFHISPHLLSTYLGMTIEEVKGENT